MKPNGKSLTEMKCQTPWQNVKLDPQYSFSWTKDGFDIK